MTPNNSPWGAWAVNNIQDAVDAATVAGALVWVSNGVYRTGARAVYGMSNRVAVTKPVTVQSVNGPAVTSIVGYQVPGTTNGPAAVRCVYLTNAAVLAGFALTNGATQTSGDAYKQRSGGGVWCESLSGVVSNCVLSGNSASSLGGGAYASTLNNCTLTGNSASTYGGGAYGTLYNCIAYFNTAPTGPNYYSASLTNCCAFPLATNGLGNFTNAPLFVDLAAGNLRLQSSSPCINAGNNGYAPGLTDLDGRPRVVGGTVDVGAYEFQGPGMSEFIGWLQQYGLATDGSADYTDPDADGHNNWQEWIAGTNPTNAASVLRLSPPLLTAPGWQLRWSSDSAHSYFVQQATSLSTPVSFTTLGGNIPGLPGVTAYTDTTAPALGPAFYRVGTGSSNSATPPSLQVPVLVPASVTLTWSSVTNRTYALERATNLGAAPAFWLLQSNLAGLPGTTSWTDTNAAGSTPRFYRVRVEN